MNNSTFKIFTIFICGQSEGRACMYLCCPSVRPIKKLEMARNHFILRFSVAKSSVSTKSPGEHSFLWIDDCLQKNQNEKDIHVTYINWNCTLMPLLKSCQFEYEDTSTVLQMYFNFIDILKILVTSHFDSISWCALFTNKSHQGDLLTFPLRSSAKLKSAVISSLIYQLKIHFICQSCDYNKNLI